MSNKKRFTAKKYSIISSIVITVLAVVLCFLAFIGDLPEETTISLFAGSVFCFLALGANFLFCCSLEKWERNNRNEPQKEMPPRKNECPNCFHSIDAQDVECQYCGYILKHKDGE